jgi:hypothetical protein
LFELPLLNTVDRVIISNIDNVAVLVKIQLYEQNLILDYFLSQPSSLLSPLPEKSPRLGMSSQQERDNNLVTKNNFNFASLEEFYKWFVGFSDAEGSFGIFPLLNNKTKIEGFSFKLTIGLHKRRPKCFKFY